MTLQSVPSLGTMMIGYVLNHLVNTHVVHSLDYCTEEAIFDKLFSVCFGMQTLS